VALIQFFMKKCRPRLVKGPTNVLFLRTDGTPKGGQGLYHLLRSCVARRLGLDINPHLYRHIGAMLFLEANPGQLETVRIMLGHKSDTTTKQFYARLKATKAIQLFTAAVLGGREEAIRKLKLG
jgi:site-specific recombinase XerD